MKRRLIRGILCISLLLVLAGCSKKFEEEVQTIKEEAQTTKDEVQTTKEEAQTTEELINKADNYLKEKLLANNDAAIGTYEKTLGGCVMEGIDENGNVVKVVEVFWQGKDGKGQDINAMFSQEQWMAYVIYEDEKEKDYGMTPCQYKAFNTGKGVANMMSLGKIEAAYLLMDDNYSSVYSDEEFIDNWNKLTYDQGKLIGIKSMYFNYDTYISYPYVTIVWEFEKGDIYYKCYLNPSTCKVEFIKSGVYEKQQYELFSQNETYEPTTKDQELLQQFANSKFNLTNALMNESLASLCNDYFKLGVGLYGYATNNCAVNSKEYMALVKKHFNSCTLTNLIMFSAKKRVSKM